ncbi:MerR family transcriptional regulator [Streptomyces sp. NA02950]|uniref:MerR family transcriptional regulator n=1 Tax=Streptomyces sp. NA02950 TaxID=2742137 RepID=UPI001591BFF7|nr:MerR family transcriptional regulator [Streptomyces sp. NA02950]QKV95249.1 MerR family transcriptional regulator [Streptomyces sp. NA02950]
MRIGELAALAGVTTRTVRHYHHLGLLPEPRRRANGYREYGLRDAIALARVRRLAELGLGLDEVRDVIADDAGRELREVLAELDADLARQEEVIRQRRVRLAGLLRQAEVGGLPAEGPVSEGLAALFGEMARASAELPGPEPAMAVREREFLTLLETVAMPEEAERMFTLFRTAMTGTPGAMGRAYETYALLDALADAEPDDPRVDEAARVLVEALPDEIVAGMRAREGIQEGIKGATAGGVRPASRAPGMTGKATGARGAAFMEAFFADFAPAQAEAVRRAMRTIEERLR